MKLKILNSGSAGNCYILESTISSLVVECGVPIQDIKKGIDFNLDKVAGVLISHEHQDHCKAYKDVVAAGLNIYCSKGTWKALKYDSHRFKAMEHGLAYPVREFTVLPFNIKHDAAEPFGFIIRHKECGTVLFMTDSYYSPFTFAGLNNIMIEANYDAEIVNDRMVNETIHPRVRDRVIESHMSIDTCKKLLQANDLTAVNNIVLLHLSDQNSNAQEFKQQVEDLTGKNVHIASRNMIIEFNKTPF